VFAQRIPAQLAYAQLAYTQLAFSGTLGRFRMYGKIKFRGNTALIPVALFARESAKSWHGNEGLRGLSSENMW
jgi:hypothetical protein